MATFVNDPCDATKGWEAHLATVDGGEDHGRDYLYVAIPEYCKCSHECCSKPRIGWTPHTNGKRWYLDEYDDQSDAYDAVNDWIEGVQENLNDQYDRYYEENHHQIVQMERYEMWQREY